VVYNKSDIMNLHSHKQTGFTLIEMIVSLAVFSFVITMSVGALLVLVATNGQLQNEQSVMTNLSFAIDSMTREIRTGTLYFCASAANRNSAISGSGSGGIQMFRDNNNMDTEIDTTTRDCHEGRTSNVQGISFIESGSSITTDAAERIVYFYDASDEKLYRRISGQPAQSIVSSGIRITNAEFFVTGSSPLDGTGDYVQPTVTVFVEAEDSDSNKPYQIQTMVTQRTLDL